MKYFTNAVLSSLILATPSLLAYPDTEICISSTPATVQIPDTNTLSYDEAMHLLERIESEDLEETCSAEELLTRTQTGDNLRCETTPNRRGQRPRSERGAPLPKARATREDRFG